MGRGAANQESPAHTLYISRSVHPPTSRQQVLAIATLVSTVCATPSFQSMLWGDVLRGCPTPLHLQWFRILSAPVGCWIGNFFSVGPSNARTHTRTPLPSIATTGLERPLVEPSAKHRPQHPKGPLIQPLILLFKTLTNFMRAIFSDEVGHSTKS